MDLRVRQIELRLFENGLGVGQRTRRLVALGTQDLEILLGRNEHRTVAGLLRDFLGERA